MPAPTTLLAWSAVLALGGASAALYARSRDLERRLDALSAEAPGAGSRDPVERAVGAPTLEGAPADRVEVAGLREQVEALERRVAGAEQRLSAGPGPGAATAADPAAFEQGVRDVLERVQREPEFKAKVAEAAGRPILEKKPTFGALAKHLSLDASQETSFRRDLEDVQGSLMALLAETRPDGRVLLEEIGRVEALPEGDPQRARVFLDLFKLQSPGTEQTYVEKALELAVTFRRKTEAYLRPEQRERFQATDVDLFGVRMN